ncbi:hypothetical protein PAXRUDRAFT_566569 [Paxillus rubicundulus Ve08.2h10]|uniref:Uncharacterized protein n=1 Tax=Paxillus rubicundulus Ve08.2h10 TaxID=930991 RepID=A0A0D0CEY8_9AGAM|nr:hypothetical protein PAXRUDRAFT_566569 [Paxillus rubicundulus Ve08.2h10]
MTPYDEADAAVLSKFTTRTKSLSRATPTMPPLTCNSVAMEFTHGVVCLSDRNTIADELDEVTDEEIRGRSLLIAVHSKLFPLIVVRGDCYPEAEIFQDTYSGNSEAGQTSVRCQSHNVKGYGAPSTLWVFFALAVLRLSKSRLALSSRKVAMGPSSIRDNLYTTSVHVPCPSGRISPVSCKFAGISISPMLTRVSFTACFSLASCGHHSYGPCKWSVTSTSGRSLVSDWVSQRIIEVLASSTNKAAKPGTNGT